MYRKSIVILKDIDIEFVRGNYCFKVTTTIVCILSYCEPRVSEKASRLIFFQIFTKPVFKVRTDAQSLF